MLDFIFFENIINQTKLLQIDCYLNCLIKAQSPHNHDHFVLSPFIPLAKTIAFSETIKKLHHHAISDFDFSDYQPPQNNYYQNQKPISVFHYLNKNEIEKYQISQIYAKAA